MSYKFSQINTFSEGVSVIKITGEYQPEISYIEPFNSNKNIGVAVIASNEKIKEIRHESRNIKTPYLKTIFSTHDGVVIRTVQKDTCIGNTGNIEGNNSIYFSKIKIPKTSDINNLSIVLDNHYTYNFVSENIINQEFLKDIGEFSNNINFYLNINSNNTVNLFFEYELFKHICENIMNGSISNHVFFRMNIINYIKNSCQQIDTNRISVIVNANNKKNYIQKYICENLFGIQIAVNKRGVVAELTVPKIVYYHSPDIEVGYIINRNILSINCNSMEKIDAFNIYLFMFSNDGSDNIIYLNQKIHIEKAVISKIYYDVNFKELNRVLVLLNKIKNTDTNITEKKKLIQDFNPYLYKFGDYPIFNVPRDSIKENEINTLINYVFETIDCLENNKQFRRNRHNINNVMFSAMPPRINDDSNEGNTFNGVKTPFFNFNSPSNNEENLKFNVPAFGGSFKIPQDNNEGQSSKAAFGFGRDPNIQYF